MSVAIKIENLSKQYRLGAIGTGTMSHDLNRFFAKIRGKEDPYLKVGETNDRSIKGDSSLVWALKDINFEVQQGEILGIIGKNGAGKSTLLKILSKVTGPTTGSIKAKGRIASLLEVGTGFHPELTGRENIYLNGAILGMNKFEIKSKLDEIVAFSGVERYLDTPVKRYSSGMMVRLGFAVAAHLEPEILVVDEVLAVGDAEFQKKAIGKMQDVSANQGRTVLFVSHNMASIKNLCNRCILMKNGYIGNSGATNVIIEEYNKENYKVRTLGFNERIDRVGNKLIEVSDFYLTNKYYEKSNSIICGEETYFTLEINNTANKTYKNVSIAIGIDNYLEIRLIHLSNELISENININPGLNRVIFKLDRMILTPAEYYATFFCSVNGEISDWLPKAISFNIAEGDFYNNGKTLKQTMALINTDFKMEILN